MKTEQAVNIKQYKPEKHVEEALILAAILAENEPVNASHLIRAINIIARRSSSEAFKTFLEILPLKDPEENYNTTKTNMDLEILNMAPGLNESFAVAEEFLLKNNYRIWGRDLITLALLAIRDTSLRQLVEKEGKDLQQIQNQWYRFVTSKSVPHEIGDWTIWWNKAGIEIPDTETPSRKTYLILWNPEKYNLQRFKEYIHLVHNDPSFKASWSFGNRNKASVGDKVFLIKLGSYKPGLVGYGTICGEVFIQSVVTDDNPSDEKSRNMVPVEWERIQENPVVPLENLASETNESQFWHNRAGGIVFSESLAEQTITIWNNYVENNFLKYKSNFLADSSDVTIDLLGYRNYSKAISEIIKDNTGKEPFNIGIIAPWGHGKTTLMKFIREDLEPDYKKKEEAVNKDHLFTSIKDLLNWIINKSKNLLTFHKIIDYHPTVWFNAWKYQSSEQIWAGIGHAIITQLVEKLDPLQQERFWFKLKSPDIDRYTLQRKIYKYILNNLPVTVVSLILTLIFGGAAYLLSAKEMTGLGLASFILGSSSGVWSFQNIKNIFKKLNSNVNGMLAEPVKAPDYTDKLGLFHQLTDDLQRVFNELVDPEKPAVIFIDDLDRCSPEVIGEVIEAINLIMTNPVVGKHCYFIFGMDAQVIAATLDDKYKNLKGKLPGCEHAEDSVGWYFLDKFIQLPFIIPIMQKDEKKEFLSNFFKTDDEEEIPDFLIDEIREFIEDAYEQENADKVGTMIKNEADPTRRSAMEQIVIEKKIKQYNHNSEEIVEQLEYLADYLSSSPREIKRYVNLLILHNVHQYLRYHKSLEVPTNRNIAKWILISIKWPQMVRWIQWENEYKLVHTNTPVAKADKLDELVRNFQNQNLSINIHSTEMHTKWLEFLERENASELKWLQDKQLVKVLMSENEDNAPLKQAIQCRVW